jgi:subtilisin-like proprotein convertase family protein
MRPCSKPDVMPWTNVTHGQAQAACEAIGGRLCIEAEWEQACMYYNSDDDFCGWSYAHPGTNCQSYDGDVCNGNDWDSNDATTEDDDAIYPTGSFPECNRQYGGGGLVHDLSGNVKEWTWPRDNQPGVNPLRGGAMNNTEVGISCGFDWTLADDSFLFFNAGFRCCFGDPPPACVASTDVPQSLGYFGGTVTSTLTVPFGGTIADVNVVNLAGNIGRFSDLSFRLRSPAGTTVTILNHDHCGDDDNWSFNLDDEAATTLQCNAPPVGNYGTYQPDNNLSAFDGQDPSGTWTLTMDDDRWSQSPTLTAWGLCIETS